MKEELNYNKDDVIKMPMDMKAVIIGITVKKGKDIFVSKDGNIKTDKPNEDFLCLQAENDEYDIKKEYHMKKFRKGAVPDNSNLGKTILRYDGIKTGMKVLLVKNSTTGYYDLVM